MKVYVTRTLRNLSTHLVSNKEFFLELGKILGKGAGTLGLLYLASKMNIPITVSADGNISTKKSYCNPVKDFNPNVPNIIFSKNAQDSAILSLMQMAEDCDYDSRRIEYIEKIYEIADGDTDDNTRMLAINSINTIISNMDWDSNKRRGANYICKLAG